MTVPDFDVQHRDCFDSLAAMRDAGGVDLILTSPPYPDARTDEAHDEPDDRDDDEHLDEREAGLSNTTRAAAPS